MSDIKDLNIEELEKVAAGTELEEEFTCSSCGTKFKIRSTNPNIRVDICPKCHPFFEGMQITIDTEGREDKFKKRYTTK